MAWKSRSQYEALRVLGDGGFGRVTLVQKLKGGGLYAVKEVNLQQIRRKCGDAKLAERCVQMATEEGSLMISLHHPNIIRVFGFFTETVLQHETYHMVMEYCDGGDLEEAIREGNFFAESTIRSWIRQITSALQHLHSNGVAHRDVKAENIFLLDQRKTVKLGDFGIAKSLEEVSQQTLTDVGTSRYGAPERFYDGKPYGVANDVWALGVVTFRTASLKFPFDGNTELMVLLSLKKRPLPSLPSRYSRVLTDFVDALLKVDPDTRPKIDDVMKLRFLVECETLPIKALDETTPATPEEITFPVARQRSTKVANGQNKQVMPELFLAAKDGNLAEVEGLLRQGADVNARNDLYCSWTALHYAATNANGDVVALLIENGADLNAKDTFDLTAIHFSANEGHKEVVKLLIEKGADVRAQMKDGCTALQYAAVRGRKEIVAMLIEAGAEVNSKDNSGMTPLLEAVSNGWLEVAALLIEKGADVNSKDDENHTALYYATSRRLKDMEALLKKHGAK